MSHAPWRDIARRTSLPWAVIERQKARVKQAQEEREHRHGQASGEIADIQAMRPLHASMSDAEVREIAGRRARLMAGKLHALSGPVLAFLAAVNELLAGWDARPFPVHAWEKRLDGVVARVMCADWWFRQLKRAVVLLRERQGRATGEVCARRHQPYVTHDTVRRMLNRDAAARAMLESTELESEDGEVITLAQAADAGTANLSIRRGELMTRIKGCEEWADIAEWEGLFTTNTTPSRFHATLHTGATNPKWVAAGRPTPKDGQAWLCKTWARCRADLARRGLTVFGIRVAEPHQDGTPHWHMLVWAKPGMWAAVAAIMADHWLRDEGDEPGAQEHRFKVKAMTAGGAAGYVAKYISKGIDDAGEVGAGGHVDDLPDGRRLVMEQGDMFGGGAARVRMWARAHGIRQFQGLGQPPVTVWRELRRVDAEAMADVPAGVLRECWGAVNRDGERRANWLVYLERQGGPCIGRGYRVRVVTEDKEHHGRYETSVKACPVGVVDLFDPDLNIVPSARKEWRPRGAWGSRACGYAPKVQATSAAGQGRRAAVLPGDTGRTPRMAAGPWTRVNNCTRERAPAFQVDGGQLERKLCEHDENPRSGGSPGRFGWAHQGIAGRESPLQR